MNEPRPVGPGSTLRFTGDVFGALGEFGGALVSELAVDDEAVDDVEDGVTVVGSRVWRSTTSYLRPLSDNIEPGPQAG